MSKKGGSDYKILSAKAVKVTAPVLAIAGWLATMVPTMAIIPSYSSNDYRTCAGQLLRVNINANAASQACAGALRPRDLSACVVKINKETQINAVEALTTCSKARRPEELASCVVGISLYPSKEAANPTILNYCGRSLLPVSFGQCVVGLRSEIKSALIPTLETCINGSDRVSATTPSILPQVQGGTEFRPTFETTPIPTQPGSN
ncbi:hypothetical protein NIES2100_24690 [Calothrix sp. NIES-2100]|uniref:hypothetical protein n=1 Tax=Calothrix sp. NIES-2100 TaxID=1954172 RepID=UPI000B601B61|nr:hypothetical protein NIES2100_24690 [Calothrix sp. NIES-2100]